MSHPNHRPRFIAAINLKFSFGIFISYGISSLDSGNRVVWRIFYGFQIILVLIDILVMLTYLRNTDSILHIIKTKGKEKAKEVLSGHFHEYHAEHIANELEAGIGKKKL